MAILSEKRRTAIMDSLNAGNTIRTGWCGSQGNGYVQYTLHGVLRLRKIEVEELEKARVIIRFSRGGGIDSFGTYRLRTEADNQAEAESKRQNEAHAQKKQAEETKRGELAALFPASEDDNRGTYVRDASYGDRDFRKERYDVTFHSLTESEVRELATKV